MCRSSSRQLQDFKLLFEFTCNAREKGEWARSEYRGGETWRFRCPARFVRDVPPLCRQMLRAGGNKWQLECTVPCYMSGTVTRSNIVHVGRGRRSSPIWNGGGQGMLRGMTNPTLTKERDGEGALGHLGGRMRWGGTATSPTLCLQP